MIRAGALASWFGFQNHGVFSEYKDSDYFRKVTTKVTIIFED